VRGGVLIPALPLLNSLSVNSGSSTLMASSEGSRKKRYAESSFTPDMRRAPFEKSALPMLVPCSRDSKKLLAWRDSCQQISFDIQALHMFKLVCDYD
jgi:hypothetical protein